MQIPLFNLHRQHQPIQEEVFRHWKKIWDDSAFTSGQETEDFVQSFAQFCRTRYAVAVRSGTASLVVALRAAGVGPGDEVITTPMTFAASADAIVLNGARPVFVDVRPENGNINPALIEAKITPRTKAILIVHLYGIPCDMDQIVRISKKHHLLLIEDASHAHGSLYKGKPVGSFGLAGCFSLYPSKTLGCAGNAGVITSNNSQFIKKAEMLAHHGIKDVNNKYRHYLSGYNELIDNLQSAVLNIKMKNLPRWIQRRREIAETYNQALAKVGIEGMRWSDKVQPSLYVYSIQLAQREQLRKFLLEKGIQTGVYYPYPLHIQPSYQYLDYRRNDLPHALKFAQQTVSLPLYPELTDGEVEYIEKNLTTFFS